MDNVKKHPTYSLKWYKESDPSIKVEGNAITDAKAMLKLAEEMNKKHPEFVHYVETHE